MKIRLVLALTTIGAAIAGPAFSGELDRARSCVPIADNNARLACFDAAFAAHAATPGAPPAAAPSVAPAAAPPTQEFGDQGQLHGQREARQALPKRVNFTVSKVEPLAQGLYRLTMDNGQVWVTKEADWALSFNAGDAVTIQRMSLGGFRVSHAGQGRNVTVTRVF